MQIMIGDAAPLGSTVTRRGVNFAVTCVDATQVSVSLYHADTRENLGTYDLPGKTGDVWHGEITGIGAGQLYGFRVMRHGNRETAQKLLVDPYAKQLSRPQHFNERQYQGDSQFMIAKGVVVADADPQVSRPPKPKIATADRIIYEAHVKGLTKRHPEVDVAEQGTYSGAAHPAVVEHIKSLGVTSVQFMPLFAFMPEPYITGKGLTNYWGYNPFTYFAPEPRYAKDIKNALAECKTMVDAYHEAGLEVILDVVFNHTAEAGDGGTDLCLRGLLTDAVYLKVSDNQGSWHYANYSGCGNTVDTTHPFMFRYIMDAMRHWMTEIGIDGFRFDLAPCLGREPHHFNRMSGLLKAMQQDPIISQAVLIAEPWDMGPGGYQLGAYPYPWLEVNDKFRDTVRGFWRGDEGLAGELATRMMGSRDCFHKAARPVHSSVNAITYHDGFTLHDLVTYNDKHNHANGEDNRDGHGHNLSYNYGKEGETSNCDIVRMREKQKRNMFATLILSQGTPHVLAGDEIGRTQLGNNNAYCQDNDISWVQWSLDTRREDFLGFCKLVIALRQSSQLLGNLNLADDTFTNYQNATVVNWYKPDGTEKATADWQLKQSRAYALEMRCNLDNVGKHEHWLLCLNAGDYDMRFMLPQLTPQSGWQLRLDTRYQRAGDIPQICVRNQYMQQAKSLVLFSYEQPKPTQD